MYKNMEPLNKKTQEEITQIIGFLLEPISGEVVSFGDPYEMRVITQVLGESERRHAEQMCAVFLKTNLGEKSLTLSLVHLYSVKDDVWRACHDFVYTDVPSVGTQQEILKRLYSQEFLEFGKDK